MFGRSPEVLRQQQIEHSAHGPDVAWMELCTVQHHAAWERLVREGVLRADQQFVHPDDEVSYRWMTEQLERHCGFRPSECSVPLWSWYQRHHEGERFPNADEPLLLAPGTAGVLIHFRVPACLVLLSDFDRWNAAYGLSYVPINEADDDRFYDELTRRGIPRGFQYHLLPEDIRAKVMRSWERVFDIDTPDPYISPGDRSRKSIQAVLWEIRQDQIYRVEPFVARDYPMDDAAAGEDS